MERKQRIFVFFASWVGGVLGNISLILLMISGNYKEFDYISDEKSFIILEITMEIMLMLPIFVYFYNNGLSYGMACIIGVLLFAYQGEIVIGILFFGLIGAFIIGSISWFLSDIAINIFKKYVIRKQTKLLKEDCLNIDKKLDRLKIISGMKLGEIKVIASQSNLIDLFTIIEPDNKNIKLIQKVVVDRKALLNEAQEIEKNTVELTDRFIKIGNKEKSQYYLSKIR